MFVSNFFHKWVFSEPSTLEVLVMNFIVRVALFDFVSHVCVTEVVPAECLIIYVLTD